MEGLFKDAGLKYAEFLPLPLSTAVIAVVAVIYLWSQVEKNAEESWKGPLRAGLIGLSILVAVQYPIAYSAAKNYCREQWEQSGGSSFSQTAPAAYLVTKCGNPWPHGPDGPPGLWTFP